MSARLSLILVAPEAHQQQQLLQASQWNAIERKAIERKKEKEQKQ